MSNTIVINEGSYATAAAPGALYRSNAPALLTFADAFDMSVAFLRGHNSEASSPVIRQAIQEAHLDIVNGYDWPGLERPWRIPLRKNQTTGTVAYDSSSRLLTLTGATWPTWAAGASVFLEGVLCEIKAYVGPTTLMLDETLCPSSDITSGASYSLVRRWYPLPADFVNFTGPVSGTRWRLGKPISMTEMSVWQKQHAGATGDVQYYAISGRPGAPAEKAVYIWPSPYVDTPMDFTYQRRPRELQYSGRDAQDSVGTISTVEGSNAISGANTQFETNMTGAVLLVGKDGTALPTGRYGLNRFSEQMIIDSVISTTSLGMSSVASATRSAVKYVVTDPIDIEHCATNAFLRYVEMHLAAARGLDSNAVHGGHSNHYIEVAQRAMRDAMAASQPTSNIPGERLPERSWSEYPCDFSDIYGK